MGPRFFQVVLVQRPSVGASGDLTLGAATAVSGAIFRRRQKAIVGGQGELVAIVGVGFFPAGTDVRYRDRLTVSGESQSYEVVVDVDAHDDRGVSDHVGVELRLI